jgi:hypothetical protein
MPISSGRRGRGSTGSSKIKVKLFRQGNFVKNLLKIENVPQASS